MDISVQGISTYFCFSAFRIKLQDGELKKFLAETKDLSSAKRGEKLVEAQGISNTHEDFAHEGQTEVCEISCAHQEIYL